MHELGAVRCGTMRLTGCVCLDWQGVVAGGGIQVPLAAYITHHPCEVHHVTEPSLLHSVWQHMLSQAISS